MRCNIDNLTRTYVQKEHKGTPMDIEMSCFMAASHTAVIIITVMSSQYYYLDGRTKISHITMTTVATVMATQIVFHKDS